MAGEALQLHVRVAQGNFKQLVQRGGTPCVSPCHSLFTGLVIQLGARSLGVPEFGPAAGHSHTRLELPSSPLPWSGSDSCLPITQETALRCLCSEPREQKQCVRRAPAACKGTKSEEEPALTRSCSDGGRGGSRKS